MLTNDEQLFMIDLVRNKPGLFLSEIHERLYDSRGTLLSVEAVHQNLVNCLSIKLKKAGTNNIQKLLVVKFAFVDKMKFYPAHWLVFTGKKILLVVIITIHYMILQDYPSCSDETSICKRDLLQTFAWSARGTPATWLVVNQNPERISLLPAILLGGLVALRTTTKTFQARGFELFLEFDLVSHLENFDSVEQKLTGLSGKLPCMNRYPGRNSVFICNNTQIHRGKRVKELCCRSGVHLMFLPL
jgi:hypothetical protein